MKISTFNKLRYYVFSCFLLLSGFFGSGQVSAQTKADSICQPYSIPMAPVPCDPGYTGSKFPMKTLQCPSGVVTTGATFDTSNCRAAGSTVDRNATNCAITPTAVGCMAPPTGQGCVVGRHWTTEGDGIAHCVNDDPNCPWGTSLVHDNLGNPSCVQNKCPSNQQLQSDGISCECPSSLPIWSNGVCTPPIVCPITQTVTSACPAGYTGNQVTTTSFSGNACTPSSSVDKSGCVVIPNCPATQVTTSACPTGYSGNVITTTTYSVQNGSCVPSSSTNSLGCVINAPKYCPDGSIMPENGVCPVVCPYPNTMQMVPQSSVPVCLHPFVSVILDQNVPAINTQSFQDSKYSSIYLSGMDYANTGLEGIGSLSILHSMVDPGGSDPRPVLIIFYGMYNACSFNSSDDGTNYTVTGYGSFGC